MFYRAYLSWIQLLRIILCFCLFSVVFSLQAQRRSSLIKVHQQDQFIKWIHVKSLHISSYTYQESSFLKKWKLGSKRTRKQVSSENIQELQPVIEIALFLSIIKAMQSIPKLKKPAKSWKPFPLRKCKFRSDDYTDCFRLEGDFFVLGTGLPTYYNRVYSKGSLRQVQIKSALNPALHYSFHKTGGWIQPSTYKKSLNLTHSSIKEKIVVDQWEQIPITYINWHQGVFGLNSFDIQINRALTPNLYLSFTNIFKSVSSRENYEYQSSVNQFYIDVLGRDSSSVVFSATSPSISTLHLRPSLSWFLNSSNSFQLYWESFKNSSNAVSLNNNTVNIGSISQEQENLLLQSFRSEVFGILWFWKNARTNFYLQLIAFSSDQEQQAISHFDVNTTSIDTLQQGVSDSVLRVSYQLDVSNNLQNNFYNLEGQHIAWKYQQWISQDWRWNFNLDYEQSILFGNYVTRIPNDSHFTTIPLQTDLIRSDQLFLIQGDYCRREFNAQVAFIKDHGSVQMEFRTNFQALKYISGIVEHTFGLEVNTRWFLTPYWFIQSEFAVKPKNPDWKNLYVSNAVLGFYPNPSLISESQRSASFKTQFDVFSFLRNRSQSLFWIFQGEFHVFDIENPILTTQISSASLGNSIVKDDLSLRLENHKKLQYFTFSVSSEFILGNWNLLLNYTALLKSSIESKKGGDLGSNSSLIPSLIKGQFFWEKDQVLRSRDYRLKVGIYWESVGQRRLWKSLSNLTSASINQGSSQVAILKSYHSIDFFTELQIKTFTLYYQMKNINQDRYQATLGTHPVGLNFRWGVSWEFDR